MWKKIKVKWFKLWGFTTYIIDWHYYTDYYWKFREIKWSEYNLPIETYEKIKLRSVKKILHWKPMKVWQKCYMYSYTSDEEWYVPIEHIITKVSKTKNKYMGKIIEKIRYSIKWRAIRQTFPENRVHSTYEECKKQCNRMQGHHNFYNSKIKNKYVK